jgi:ribosome maturation factor RimP
MPSQLVEKLRVIIQPSVEGAGYELVDLEWKREPQGWVCRVFIDGPGGISHKDCERMSRELSPLLDVHDAIPHAFSLELSSPGLNRPLRTAEHFRRHAGQKARIRLCRGIDGRRNYTGRIVAVAADGARVTVEVDGSEVTLPLDDLERANLEYQFDP